MTTPRHNLPVPFLWTLIVSLAAASAAAAEPLPEPQPNASTDQPAAPQFDPQGAREWLLAYLIAREGYKLDQLDQLQEHIAKMTDQQVQSLVAIYRQSSDEAARNRAMTEALRNQMLDVTREARDRQQAILDGVNVGTNAAALFKQLRLDRQQDLAIRSFYRKQNNRVRYRPFGGFDRWGVGRWWW